MNMENRWNEKRQGNIGLEEKLPYFHFIHHKFHMECPEREQDPGVYGEKSGLTA
jgi:hypothetical protein